jgi:hypothetical protein
MRYTYHKLGHLKKGQRIEVTLAGNAANIFLMDEATFKCFQLDQVRRGSGGLMKSSPVNLLVPQAGKWFVTIDFGGYSGKVKTNVKVYPAEHIEASKQNAIAPNK